VATGMPNDLLRRRPDVRQAEFAAAAQSAAIGVAKANLYPSFSLSGFFGFATNSLSGQATSDIFHWDNRAISIGPSFVFPLFNYGRLENAVRVQDAAFQQAVLNYQNTVLTAQQEVEDARTAFTNAHAELATLNDAAISARKTTQLAVVRYREGASDYTTVLTAEQAQLRVEDELASAYGSVPLALVSVYRALGGGWELRAGHDLVAEDVKQEMIQRTDWNALPESGRSMPTIESVEENSRVTPQNP
jgi:outer membrane protein TolC